MILRLLTAAAAATLIFASGAPAEHSPEWVQSRAAAWQPTSRERRWEQIGWAKDICSAERLARSSHRLVFLFTHDGRLNVGRC